MPNFLARHYTICVAFWSSYFSLTCSRSFVRVLPFWSYSIFWYLVEDLILAFILSVHFYHNKEYSFLFFSSRIFFRFTCTLTSSVLVIFSISSVDYSYNQTFGRWYCDQLSNFHALNNVLTVIVLNSFVVDDPFHSPVELVWWIVYIIIKFKSFELFTSRVLGYSTVITSVVDFVATSLVRLFSSSSSFLTTSSSAAISVLGHGDFYLVDTICIM